MENCQQFLLTFWEDQQPNIVNTCWSQFTDVCKKFLPYNFYLGGEDMKRQYPTNYLGNNNPQWDREFHYLENENANCQIDEIIRARHDVPLRSKEEARAKGFDPCAWCMSGESRR